MRLNPKLKGKIMEPLGDGVGVQIAKTRKIVPAIVIGFAMEMLITISEPDLQVLAFLVPEDAF